MVGRMLGWGECTDNLSPAVRRRTMQAIRSDHTQLEERVCRALWHTGVRYRRNVRGLLGVPDIAVKKVKVAIFLDSCFWHGCPDHGNIPHHNREYWERKLARNQQRDAAVNLYYQTLGWTVLRIWEHEAQRDLAGVVARVVGSLRGTETITTADGGER